MYRELYKVYRGLFIGDYKGIYWDLYWIYGDYIGICYKVYRDLFRIYRDYIGFWGIIQELIQGLQGIMGIYKGFKEDYTRFKVDLWVGYRDSRSIIPISLTFIGIIRIYQLCRGLWLYTYIRFIRIYEDFIGWLLRYSII